MVLGLGRNYNYDDITFGGHINLTSSEMIEQIYAMDKDWASESFWIEEGWKQKSTEDRFLYPKGLCQQLTKYNMSEVLRLSWLLEAGPDLIIHLTDPNRQTHFHIDISSQKREIIEWDTKFDYYYEVNIQVEDMQDPANPDACTDTVSFSDCVDEKMHNMFKEVS